MSDLCIYELEENVWDEFSESDDHMVPRPGDEYGDKFDGDSRKKSRHELINLAIISDDTAKSKTTRKEETSLPTFSKKDTMLDKGSWSHTPDAVFSTPCDNSSMKEVTQIASGEARISNPCLKDDNTDMVSSGGDPIMGGKCATGNVNAYSYPLNNISQTSDLGFFDSNHEEKDGSDLLYYGWPDDIGNFEDVDRMFRSCDSTFGLGSLSNDDDLCWFSSSHSPEGSEGALKSGSKFSSSEASRLKSVSDDHEAFRVNNIDLSVSDSNKRLFMGDTTSSRTTSAADHSSAHHLTFPNSSDAKSVSKDGFLLTKQINTSKKQSRHKNQPEGKRKDRNMENGASFHHNSNSKQCSDKKHPLRGSSCQSVALPGVKQKIVSDSLNYLQTNTPYMLVEFSHSPDQISVSQIQSGVKSESNGQLSPSPKESSYASSQLQSMESSHGPAHEAPSIAMTEKEECLNHSQGAFSKSFQLGNLASPTPFYDPVSVQKQTCDPEYEIEDPHDIDGISLGLPAELDFSNAQESSCLSSVLDEISLEATSFRQLQQVMEQLDVRTKLCIRDSLYRLARSAEQRHKFGNSSGSKRDDCGALDNEETNESAGFMDMETDTNPIDRSIAHLLFHRPAEPPGVPANDAFSLKSNAIVHTSISSPPLMAEEQACQEESATGVEKTLLTCDNKQ